jgi:cysteine desulfurase / selenocysteine lyase
VATATASPITDWRQEWFEIEDAIYLNLAGQSPMPKVAHRAVQTAIEWKKFPHRIADSAYFEIPNRIRASIAQLIGGKSEEVALTSGASTGMSAVAYGLTWKPGDEVLTAKGEFPLQYATWKPMEAREGIVMKVVSPRERFITADDFLAAMTPKTRMVSASLVRFDNGVLLDAARIAAACHAQGALLLLDVSQCCGGMPLDVAKLGADFLVCAGYKWLLSPYGTGFFWAKNEHTEKMRPGPFYWAAAEGAQNFHSLALENPKPVRGARRWDIAETSNYFNFAAMDASLQFVLQLGPETVEAHNRKLIDFLFERLPKDRCVPASPLDSAHRGPYGCFAARSPEKTSELYQKLVNEKIITSLREGNIRVSPHLYNTARDIDHLITAITL